MHRFSVPSHRRQSAALRAGGRGPFDWCELLVFFLSWFQISWDSRRSSMGFCFQTPAHECSGLPHRSSDMDHIALAIWKHVELSTTGGFRPGAPSLFCCFISVVRFSFLRFLTSLMRVWDPKKNRRVAPIYYNTLDSCKCMICRYDVDLFFPESGKKSLFTRWCLGGFSYDECSSIGHMIHSKELTMRMNTCIKHFYSRWQESVRVIHEGKHQLEITNATFWLIKTLYIFLYTSRLQNPKNALAS